MLGGLLVWETLIGSIGTLFGVVITYLTFVKGRDKEIKEKASEQTTMTVQLQHIGTGVDEIKKNMNDNEEKVNKMHNDLIRVDESAKSAHKRIDNLVEKER